MTPPTMKTTATTDLPPTTPTTTRSPPSMTASIPTLTPTSPPEGSLKPPLRSDPTAAPCSTFGTLTLVSSFSTPRVAYRHWIWTEVAMALAVLAEAWWKRWRMKKPRRRAWGSGKCRSRGRSGRTRGEGPHRWRRRTPRESSMRWGESRSKVSLRIGRNECPKTSGWLGLGVWEVRAVHQASRDRVFDAFCQWLMLFFLGFMLYLQSWGRKLKISLFFYDGNAKKSGGKMEFDLMLIIIYGIYQLISM